MSKKNYQILLVESEKTAKAMHPNARISKKYSREICRELKGKKIDKALAFLNRVKEKKEYLPLRRFRLEMGHRKGKPTSFTKSGRYPFNACEDWIELLESAKSNADVQGMDVKKLYVFHAFSSQGFERPSHQPQGHIGGRSRKKKSTHIEVVLKEAA